MDVMEPPLVYVDGGCYRFFERDFWNKDNDNYTTLNFDDCDIERFEDLESAFGSIDEFFETPDVEADNEPDFEDFENEVPPSEIEILLPEMEIPFSEIKNSHLEIDIVPIKDGLFRHSFHLNMRYFPILVGYKGTKKASIESETNTSINLPDRGKGNEVVITGHYVEGIIAAKNKINSIVESTGFNLNNDAIPNTADSCENDTGELDEEIPLDMNIRTTQNGAFRHSFILDRKYHGSIIGPHQSTKYEIETMTGTHLRLPRFGEPSEIVIVGHTKRAVVSAKRKIDAIIEKQKNGSYGKQTANVEAPKVKESNDCGEKSRCQEIEIVPMGKGEYKHSFLTDRRYFSYMIGPSGSTCKAIQMKTGTRLIVPRLGEGEEVVIQGPKRDGIISARRQLDEVIEKYKNDFGSNRKIDMETPKSREFDDFQRKTPVGDIKIVPNVKTGYKHTFCGETRYFPIIVGAGGCIKHDIEFETNTSIDIPREGRGNEVVIQGMEKEGIVCARHKIDAIVHKFKSQAGYIANTGNEPSNTQEFHDINKNTPTPDIKIVPGDNGGYKHVFPMQWRYYPFIIGARGCTKNVIEKKTGTYFDVPKMGEGNLIVITGHNKHGIVAARHKIDEIIKTHRINMDNRINKSEFTHFISIPINDSVIASNYVTFKNFVLNETGKDSRGVREAIFQKPEKLHLLVGMLVLTHPRDILSATEALNECKEIIIKPIVEKIGPIKLKAQGLSSMINANDQTDVLKCNVTTENNVLQKLVNQIVEFFLERGLMTNQTSRLMDLNIKLMSSKFDKKEPSKHFCVNDILREHKGHFFGETQLKAVHISERGKYDDKGYYATIAKINIP